MLPAKAFKGIGVFIVGMVLLFRVASPVWAVTPAHDNFADATLVTTLPFHDVFDIDEATTEPGEPVDSYCYWLSQTVWYKFTSPVDTVVRADTADSYFGATALLVFEASNASFGDLNLIDCNSYGGSVTFYARANVTYYLQLGGLGTEGGATGFVNFNLTLIPGPANDNFADATSVTGLPFDQEIDITGATREPNEPLSCCDFAYGSVWYTFHTDREQLLSVFAYGPFFKEIGIYTGNTLSGLTKITSSAWSDVATFKALTNTTYYLQVSSLNATATPLSFALAVTPPPEAAFYFNPGDPSLFDTIQFSDNTSDPGGMEIQTCQWQFGDKKSATGCTVTHTYAKDGNYQVQLTVTTVDGRTATTVQTVVVATHDVAITKFTRPSSARAGRTYKVMVGISNTRYPERVQVNLFKSSPQGYEEVGLLTLSVPVRAKSKTTNFYFSYTFTNADAVVGKVTFKAVATLLTSHDALPADNEFISFPVKVKGKAGKSSDTPGIVLEEFDGYVTDVTSNLLGLDAEMPVVTKPEPAAANHQLFMPLVSKAE